MTLHAQSGAQADAADYICQKPDFTSCQMWEVGPAPPNAHAPNGAAKDVARANPHNVKAQSPQLAACVSICESPNFNKCAPVACGAVGELDQAWAGAQAILHPSNHPSKPSESKCQ